MKKSIMMTDEPQWVAKILNGEKTVEMRKNKPSCELPIDVYLYCTKGKPYLYDFSYTSMMEQKFGIANLMVDSLRQDILNGKVVAKFTLNKVEPFISAKGNPKLYIKACMGDTEVAEYGRGFQIYAWHIDNLVIFDEPMALSEFYMWNRSYEQCSFAMSLAEEYMTSEEILLNRGSKILTKAPQSWQYVYARGELK